MLANQPMATLTIRNLNDDVKHRLRQLAARNGHSMEEEARRILSRAVIEEEKGLGTFLMNKFAAIGGFELDLPDRSAGRPLPNFFDDDV